MKSRFFGANMAWIAVVVAITFSSSTVWAQSHAYPAQKSERGAEISTTTIVVEHSRRADVEALTARYEKHTAATVISVVVTQEEAAQMGLTASTSPDAMSAAETSRYSERELAVSNLAKFEGGDVVVAISVGGILLIVLVVILVVILLD